MAESPDPYALKNDDGPRMKYIPLPGEKRSRRNRERRRDDPFWVRLMEWDPFPLIMVVAVALWLGLGLGARHVPWLAAVLTAAGVCVFVLGQVYLYALIFRDDARHGILSLLSDWYRSAYLHFNIELTWKPIVISGTGVLMVLTGTFGALSRAKLPAGL